MNYIDRYYDNIYILWWYILLLLLLSDDQTWSVLNIKLRAMDPSIVPCERTCDCGMMTRGVSTFPDSAWIHREQYLLFGGGTLGGRRLNQHDLVPEKATMFATMVPGFLFLFNPWNDYFEWPWIGIGGQKN